MDKNSFTKAMRWDLADWLKETRLDKINQMCQPVNPQNTFYVRYGKRVLDLIISGLALVITLPVNLVIGIITFFDVGMPIFFKQERTGKDGKIFTIIKFRNMRNTKDEQGDLLPPDQRVTTFGKFVRKTSLDELLNFWSVFKGDMSLIGPRPLVPEYAARFSDRHRARLAVRPGLECPPRKVPTGPVTWQEQFENDVWYVENVSFRTDCYMCLQLLRYAFDKKNSQIRSTGRRGIYIGYDLNGTAITFEELSEDTIQEYLKVKENIV